MQALSGDLKFQTALADWRKYFFISPVTFAVRGIHYGRYGTDAESRRISPLYIGTGSLIRGYDIDSIGPEECVAHAGLAACPVFDRLIGSKIAVANVEVRVPLFGTQAVRPRSAASSRRSCSASSTPARRGAATSIVEADVQAQHATDRVPVVQRRRRRAHAAQLHPARVLRRETVPAPDAGHRVTGFNIIPGW